MRIVRPPSSTPTLHRCCRLCRLCLCHHFVACIRRQPSTVNRHRPLPSLIPPLHCLQSSTSQEPESGRAQLHSAACCCTLQQSALALPVQNHFCQVQPRAAMSHLGSASIALGGHLSHEGKAQVCRCCCCLCRHCCRSQCHSSCHCCCCLTRYSVLPWPRPTAV